MDYKAELERLKAYLQAEIDFINDDDVSEDRYVRQANKSTLEKVNQILKRGEADTSNESSGLPIQHVSQRSELLMSFIDELIDDINDNNPQLAELRRNRFDELINCG